MSYKQKALKALEVYRGNSKGLYASIVTGCIDLLRSIPEVDVSDMNVTGDMVTLYDPFGIPFSVEAKGYEAKHIVGLLEAEANSRLVALPCRQGDRLFVLTSDSPTGIEETHCKRIVIVNRNGAQCAKVIVPCIYDEWGKAVRELLPSDFGKTVFFTRQGAEDALKEAR